MRVTAGILLQSALLAALAGAATGLWRGRSVQRALARSAEVELEVPGLADLLVAAVTSGVSVPGALVAVGQAAGGEGGRTLARAGTALARGAPWSVAWAGCPARLAPLERALADAWHSGAAPVPVLRHVATRARRERREAAGEVAARLGVRLVLPLGLCLLPSFALLGIVPLVLSLGADLLGGA